jgi:chromosome segregation ATPase
MAGLDFMESLALGMIAGRSGGLAEEGVAALRNFQHKQQVAQADAAYAALVDEYNYVVDRHDTVVERFWRIHGHYKEWRGEAERLRQVERQLRQELTTANERADTAERLRAEAAAHDAQLRSDVAFWKDTADRRGNIGTKHAIALGKAQERIAQLEAEIASLRQDGQGL